MPNVETISYTSEDCVKGYFSWRGDQEIVNTIPLCYFGDLTGKTMVDFGCGDGLFLRECVKRNAAYCLGFDLNETMIKANSSTFDKNMNEKVHLAVQDCFVPIASDFGQFDNAICQFALHSCDSVEKMETLFRNAFHMLKPGGKFCIAQVFSPRTKDDQEAFADMFGVLLPLKQDQDPLFGPTPMFRRKQSSDKRAARYTREVIFVFEDYVWSREKLTRALAKTGFENVEFMLPSRFNLPPDPDVNRIDSLDASLAFIAAEKPFGYDHNVKDSKSG